jgi:hypothetical protein
MSSERLASTGTSGADDYAFVRRVLITSAWLGALVVLVGGVYLGTRWGLGFAGGALVGAANLVFLTVLVRETVRLGKRRYGRILAILALKIPIVYGGLAGLLIWRVPATVAVVLGFSLPLIVITLKAAGRAIFQSGLLGRAPRGSLRDRLPGEATRSAGPEHPSGPAGVTLKGLPPAMKRVERGIAASHRTGD